MIRIDGHRTLAAEQNAEGWTTSCPGDTHLGWMPDVRAVARAQIEGQEDDMTGYKYLRDADGTLWEVQYMKDKTMPDRGFPNWRRKIAHPNGQRYMESQLGPPQQVGTDGNYNDGEFGTIPIIG